MCVCVCVCVCVRKKNMLKHGWGSFVLWWMQICTVTRIKMRGDYTYSHNQVFNRKWLGVLEFCVVVSPFLQFCYDVCQVYYKNTIITTTIIIIIIIITIFIIIIAFLLSLGRWCCFQDKLTNNSWEIFVVHATPTMRQKSIFPKEQHKIIITIRSYMTNPYTKC